MFRKLKSLLDRLLPERSQPIVAGILALIMVVTSGFWWVSAIVEGEPWGTMPS